MFLPSQGCGPEAKTQRPKTRLNGERLVNTWESQSLFTEIVSNNAHAIMRDLLTARLMLVVISVSLFCRPRLLKGWTVLSCFHRISNTKIGLVTHPLNNLAKLSHTDIISGRREHMK